MLSQFHRQSIKSLKFAHGIISNVCIMFVNDESIFISYLFLILLFFLCAISPNLIQQSVRNHGSATDNEVRIVEVGPRDGLQNESKFVETDVKVEFINRLSKVGFQNIEVTR